MKWVIYEFDARPPPDDFVRKVGTFRTRWGAERYMKRQGLWTFREWSYAYHRGVDVGFYYEVRRLPKQVRWR